MYVFSRIGVEGMQEKARKSVRQHIHKTVERVLHIAFITTAREAVNGERGVLIW